MLSPVENPGVACIFSSPSPDGTSLVSGIISVFGKGLPPCSQWVWNWVIVGRPGSFFCAEVESPYRGMSYQRGHLLTSLWVAGMRVWLKWQVKARLKVAGGMTWMRAGADSGWGAAALGLPLQKVNTLGRDWHSEGPHLVWERGTGLCKGTGYDWLFGESWRWGGWALTGVCSSFSLPIWLSLSRCDNGGGIAGLCYLSICALPPNFNC